MGSLSEMKYTHPAAQFSQNEWRTWWLQRWHLRLSRFMFGVIVGVIIRNETRAPSCTHSHKINGVQNDCGAAFWEVLKICMRSWPEMKYTRRAAHVFPQNDCRAAFWEFLKFCMSLCSEIKHARRAAHILSQHPSTIQNNRRADIWDILDSCVGSSLLGSWSEMNHAHPAAQILTKSMACIMIAALTFETL